MLFLAMGNDKKTMTEDTQKSNPIETLLSAAGTKDAETILGLRRKLPEKVVQAVDFRMLVEIGRDLMQSGEKLPVDKVASSMIAHPQYPNQLQNARSGMQTHSDNGLSEEEAAARVVNITRATIQAKMEGWHRRGYAYTSGPKKDTLTAVSLADNESLKSQVESYLGIESKAPIIAKETTAPAAYNGILPAQSRSKTTLQV